jgi:hypothetical protein
VLRFGREAEAQAPHKNAAGRVRLIGVTDALDIAVAAALDATARGLEARAATGPAGPAGLTEVRDLKPEFRDALSAAGVGEVQSAEKRIAFRTWEPHGVKGRLGGVDVVVGEALCRRAFFELKWARSKKELGWTLWDIYKLVAGRIEYGVAAYAVVRAPVTTWEDDAVDCAALYCDGTWNSRELFRRYERAWRELLAGGRARPRAVPAAITTRVVGTSALEIVPAWELRALRIDLPTDVWLDFDGDWPVAE